MQPDADGSDSFHPPTSDYESSSSVDGEPEDAGPGAAINPAALVPKEPSRKTMRHQAQHFYRIEYWARVLNATLTPYEKHCLEKCTSNLLAPLLIDVKKVISNYGRPQGAQAACKRVLKYMAQEQKVEVGQVLPTTSVIFSMCKHLLLAERATEALMEGPNCVGCSCLSETYCMPEGCKHKKLCLYSRDRFLPTTLCGTCSKCLRCNQLLD